jgi:hypothetical protein
MFARQFKMSHDLDADAENIPHLLFVVEPQIDDKLGGRGVMRASVASKHVGEFIIKALGTEKDERQIDFFMMICKHPSLKGAAGYMLEILFYAWFHGDAGSGDMSCVAASGASPIQIPVIKEAVEFGGYSKTKTKMKLDGIPIPFGWIPTSPTQLTFDAVAITDRDIITIQITVSPTHDINPKGFKQLKKYIPVSFREGRGWHHVFVTNDDHNAKSLRRQKVPTIIEEEGISLHSAVLDVSQLGVDFKHATRYIERLEAQRADRAEGTAVSS